MTWTCSDCQVHVHWLPGFDPPPLPTGWAEIDGGFICLSCQRDRVVSAVTGPDGEVDREANRRALVAFEHRRDPEASSSEIAHRLGGSPSLIGKTRKQLLTEGVIDPPLKREPVSQKVEAPAPRKSPVRQVSRRTLTRQSIEAELSANPAHADGWIAQRVGTSNSTVRRARVRLEEAGTIPLLEMLVRSDGREVKRSMA